MNDGIKQIFMEEVSREPFAKFLDIRLVDVDEGDPEKRPRW